jgi:hypothetical protein
VRRGVAGYGLFPVARRSVGKAAMSIGNFTILAQNAVLQRFAGTLEKVMRHDSELR